MKTFNELSPPRQSDRTGKANANIKSGFRKFFLLIVICISISVGLKAQFKIDNQSPCDWDVELYVAYYNTCNYFSPPIPVVAAASSITTVNVANYYPCANCRVAKVRVYGQGGGTYVEVGDNNTIWPPCSSPSEIIGDCPNGGIWKATYNSSSSMTIAK